jgi:hypothetical protein
MYTLGKKFKTVSILKHMIFEKSFLSASIFGNKNIFSKSQKNRYDHLGSMIVYLCIIIFYVHIQK